MDSLQARQTWELENRIEPVASADVDTIYRYDERIHADVLSQKPWTKDPHYFKNVRISALALLKMVVHARSGDTIEVMGIMQGKVVDGTVIYYSLDITYFKSSLDSHLLDLLWNKYWVNTLSSSQLLANRDYVAGQISDLAEKLEQAEGQLAHSGRIGGFLMPPQRRKEEESPLSRSTRDSTRITVEQLHGLMSQVMKDLLFNSVAAASKPDRAQLQAASSSGGEPMVEA
ncbi:unnamed protein product [Closterium sp. NIES-54]